MHYPETPPRSREEEAQFTEAVHGLVTLFSHPYTIAFRLTRMPADWPDTYDLPITANVALYSKRAWCFLEQQLMSLVKDSELSLDLGQLPTVPKEGEQTDRYNRPKPEPTASFGQQLRAAPLRGRATQPSRWAAAGLATCPC